jgi:hypothetical protein
VTALNVLITQLDGLLIEQGSAAQESAFTWLYRAQAVAAVGQTLVRAFVDNLSTNSGSSPLKTSRKKS